MGSYENKLFDEEGANGKISIPMLKYFWQMSPLTQRGKDTIPKFLRNISALQNFSDYELFHLSRYFHMRTFSAGEKIFNQGDVGVGFYLIFQGDIEITAENPASEVDNAKAGRRANDTVHTSIALLDRNDYFGELALLQENSLRSATATARNSSVLLGIFKPDLETLIDDKPKIAAKLLQSISVIVANRLYLVTKELKVLKYKLAQGNKKNG